MKGMWKIELLLRVPGLILLWILLLVRLASAQTWVEQRTFVKDGQVSVRIDGLITKSFAHQLGGFTWFQTEKGYSEAYGGLTYSPKPWLQLAAGPGTEQAKSPLRVGGFVWMGSRKSSLLFIPEYGGSGFWWKLETNQKVSKRIGLGFLTERFKGSGPRMEFAIPKTPLVVWAAPMFERRRTNAIFALRWVL